MTNSNNELSINQNKLKLLSSSAYVFSPIYAIHFESPTLALVYKQLLYRATTKGKGNKLIDNDVLSVRFSYTRLAKMFGYSRRWMVKIVSELVTKEAIEIQKNGRVNTLVFKKIKLNVEETTRNNSKMLVFPELLNEVGLLEAIALQQIHIRHCKKDGSFWVVRSYKQWQDEVFMYMSISTVKRLFKKLEYKKLLLVQKYEDEFGYVNSYRVNYQKIASILHINEKNQLGDSL